MEAQQVNSQHSFDFANSDNSDTMVAGHDDSKQAFLRMDFLDCNGNFSPAHFEEITGLPYINYLRLHDDMI